MLFPDAQGRRVREGKLRYDKSQLVGNLIRLLSDQSDARRIRDTDLSTARIAMSRDRSIFSRQEHLKQRLASFGAIRTAGSRAAFLKLLENLAKIDCASIPDDDGFQYFAIAHILIEFEGQSGCIYSLLKAYFWFRLELPVRFKTRLSPRLDLSPAQTYADAAEIVYWALRETTKPMLIGAFGRRVAPDGAGVKSA